MKNMTKKKPRRKHTCKHCGKEWDEDYLADLCFKDDMYRLEKEAEAKFCQYCGVADGLHKKDCSFIMSRIFA